LKPDEIADMKVDGKITVTCEFCSTVYDFGDETLDTLVPG
jgi:redox-regulated HSP33 family molecular chaperone